MNPFREVFSDYALLFYLTIRAGQLGDRTAEFPVSWRYPAKGKTPTKIFGLSGRFAMIRELLDLVRGACNPPRG
ncbi:hypothetical protein [Roseomonas harenae]|uniref:hypothetical protein n=1 Tax=Muricoccus harenae TaxID=2692566 RepID=UPI0013313002|nr:hypothetical protein [Roseomonas harenae]